MAGLLIAGIVFGTVFVAELPDNSGLASLVLGTRYRPGGVIAGAFAAFAVHVVLAVTCGSLLALLPHKIVQVAVAVVFLIGAVLLLRGDDDDDDDDEIRLRAEATGFWAVAATSFGVILLAELGDLSDITIANLAARYHDPVPVAIGSVLPMSIPVAGITTSHKPNTVATLISVRRSTPLTPMAIAAPKLFSPSATATTSSATMTGFSRVRTASVSPRPGP